jgi:ribosomal protein L21
MADNKDEVKDKKEESKSADNENQENIHESKSVTLDELGKQFKSEVEFLKELSKAGNVTINIGNWFSGKTRIKGNVAGRDQSKRAKSAKKSSKTTRTKKTANNVADWLDKNQSIEDRILLLSVAVFNGASVQIITDAQRMLQKLVTENEPEKKSKPTLFESSINKRLESIGASIKDGEEDTQYGRIRTKIIELDDPSLSATIIKRYWDETKFDDFHEILVQWLRDSVENTPFQMRVRAAIAVGELLRHDFRSVELAILNKWATSSNPATRASAAIAVSIPGLDDELVQHVIKLLHHWSTVNNWRLCWTATATYGGPTGLKFTSEALKDMTQIAKTGDMRLVGVLTQSVSNLLDQEDATKENKDLYEKIFDALIDWTETTKEVQGTIGLFVFLNLARNSRVKAVPEGDDWYTLLWLLQKRDKHPSKQILSLWRRALNFKQSRKDALEILNDWVKAVEQDARLYEPLEWLLREIASSGESREAERIRYYLQKMEEQPETSITAERLLRVI